MSEKISVVVPVYKNAGTLTLLIHELDRVLTTLSRPYEIIFVVDGCPGQSLDVLLDRAYSGEKIRILSLSKNLGQNWAVMVGLFHAGGDLIIIMDADLQDPPSAIPDLLNALDKNTSAVFAGRRGHYEPRMRQFTSKIFKIFLHKLSGGRIPPDAGLFLIMKKDMLERLMEFRIMNPYVISLIGRTGLTLKSIPVERAGSSCPRSSYSFSKRLLLGWQAVSALQQTREFYGGTSGPKTISQQIREDFGDLISIHNDSQAYNAFID